VGRIWSGGDWSRAFGGTLPVLVVAAVLLVGWELLAAWYFNANVTPEFRVGAITGADPTVPAEMRVVQTRLPFPSLVMLTLFDPANASQLWVAGLITLRGAVIGFAIGGAIGFLLALAMDQARALERGLLPYVIASQMIRVDPNALDLMASFAASRRQVYSLLRIPAALPYVFQALKIAATASVVGAVVVELMGAQQGIGVTILRTQYYGPANAYKLWGAIVVASILGIALFQTVATVERFVLRWQPELRRGGA
jgi:NitT/TauT family transport system permease protein